MTKAKKTLKAVLDGNTDSNIAFRDLCSLLLALGFHERVRGSHHSFKRAGVVGRITLNSDGKLAKAYQVEQVRKIILEYKLHV